MAETSRKIFELNFYCNLALHINIDRPPRIVREKLHNVARGKSYSNSIIGFASLHEQLIKFFTDNGLPNFYTSSTPDERAALRSIFNDIYSDTPISVSIEGREFTVTIEKVDENQQVIKFDIDQ